MSRPNPIEWLSNQRPALLLLARIVVALIFLWHGVPKALDPSMAYDKFVGFGLPGWLGPVIGWAEVVAALLVISGYLLRWASLLLAAIVLGALATVQIPGGITAALERDLLLLTITLVLAAHRPRHLAVKEQGHRE